MLNYQDFCNSFTFKNCTGNLDAQNVFDFLCLPENIHNMIIFSELKLPAISGIVSQLESQFANAPQFPLTDHRNRQVVGRMVRFILKHFGYGPFAGGLDERAKLRNFSYAKLFVTASVYEKKNPPINSIVVNIIWLTLSNLTSNVPLLIHWKFTP